MRLAIVSTILHYPWGGPDKRWTALAEACLARGDAVFLGLAPLAADHPRVEALVGKGAILWLRPGHSAYRGKIDSFRRQAGLFLSHTLEGELARFQPDMMFLLQGGNMDCLLEYHLLRWCRRKNVPYILSASLARALPQIDEVARQGLNRDYVGAAASLFQSNENLRLTEQILMLRLKNARVIQNPVEVNMCDGGLPEQPASVRPQLGFVGRLNIRHKGLDLLCEAMGRLRQRQDMDLHLTGRCEDPAGISALVERHGLEGRVFLHPHAAPFELATAYRRAELVVLPSRWEGCANVMLEAMMCGRPQLVTPVGGVPDWLTDGVNAFIAEDVSARSIEVALERALAQRQRWPEMGLAARQAFEAKRDPDPVGTLVKILDETVKHRGAKAVSF
jgi:glycosyltransferase involved in cell wall biosynthesis